ncbi:hypothetical protein EC991_009577, partial [Linnemannia zychae]
KNPADALTAHHSDTPSDHKAHTTVNIPIGAVTTTTTPRSIPAPVKSKPKALPPNRSSTKYKNSSRSRSYYYGGGFDGSGGGGDSGGGGCDGGGGCGGGDGGGGC